MGNSLSETIGLVTSITEITKNANRSARGVNSILSSLSQTLDSASSNGKKIIQIFEGLGVAMNDSNGQLLSGFDLLKGLSDRWSTLDKNTQIYIATTIAGEILPLQGEYAGTYLEPYILNYNRNIIVA